MTDDYYDSLDLRLPVKQLLRKWRWIAAAALLAAATAAGFTLLLPVVYHAEAAVVVSPTRTEVQLDPRIQTLVDYQLIGGSLVARRDSLVALMMSNEVVQAVLSEMEDQLEPDERDLTWLRETVNVQISGDLINLEVRHRDPEKAALLANTWVEQYERHINELYSARGNLSGSPTEVQLSAARAAYDMAQSALEAFEADNPVERLQRELDATLATVENYQQARIAVETMPGDRNQALLINYYDEFLQTERWLSDAIALRDQVAGDSVSGPSTIGNAVALIALRSQVFGGQTEESGTLLLQVDLATSIEEPVTVDDVDSLIAVLQERQNATRARIDNFLMGLSTEMNEAEVGQIDQQITRLTDDVARLRSEIEATNAAQRELIQQRDSTWETYQLLQKRQIEEEIASQTTSEEVRIADRAVAPSEPASRGLIRNTLIALVLGAFVAAGVVLVGAWWATGEEAA